MGFGQGYVPRESEKLEPGEYEARILGARPEQTKNGTPYLAVYVQVKGHPHCRPNSMTFYDRPYVGEKEQVRWDEKMTEFLDAFHMPRDTPLGGPYESWKGATGWVRRAATCLRLPSSRPPPQREATRLRRRAGTRSPRTYRSSAGRKRRWDAALTM